FYDGASSELLPPPYFVSPDVTTTYEVWIDDFCGSPTGYYSITIFVFEPPDIEIRADIEAGCKPLTVNFYDELYEAGKTYDWDYGDGSNDLLSYLPNPEHTFYSTGIYSVTLEVISPAGCVSIVTHPELIEVYPVPKARFHPDPVITSIVDPHVFFNNNSDDNFINTWDFGDGSDPSNAINGEHLYHGVGEYLITLNIENEEGCVDKTEQIITIRNEYTFYVPNAISPNSMITENRYFMATGVGIDPKNFHMIIYDRWGTKIFETFDVFHPWDGRVFGSDAEKGASFPWVIIYKDMNGEEHRESGTVTVIN
ncbi:MAG: PKD domain-containing protein, partial [Bacteroidota bacterium]|nr:PKD domain-containing protein [Bacteroidota bacterium]